MSQTRRHVFYSGHVQGVGFRYNVLRCAQPRAVTGFVRNLDDGRVELVAEGDSDEVQRLLHDVRDTMSGNIHDESEEEDAPTGEFSDFSIRM